MGPMERTGRIAKDKFDIDLRDGEAGEDAFVHVFLRAKVEHKRDHKCAQTGNLFVEYRQKGRPSGLATSAADYWAFEYDVDCWIIVPAERLKRVAQQAYRNPANRVRGGDGRRFDGVRLPIVMLVPKPRIGFRARHEDNAQLPFDDKEVHNGRT